MTTDERGRALYVRIGGHASGHGYRAWLARSMGTPTRTVARWIAGGYPPAVGLIFELLDMIPPNRWPARWHISRD